MELQAILFDHDGTLVDSEPCHLELWRQAIAPYGGTVTDEQYWQRLLGVPAEQNAEVLIEIGQLAVDVETLVQAKVDCTERFLASSYFPAIESADAMLRQLADKLPLALVSGSQRLCIDATLTGHNWHHLFQQVVTADDVERNKPYPDSYLSALAALAADADKSVAIEDTESGVKAAAAAGLSVIAIRNSNSKGHDFSAATVEVASLHAAWLWLQQRYPQLQ